MPTHDEENQNGQNDPVTRIVRECTDKTRPLDVRETADPNNGDTRQAHLQWGQRPLKEHHEIANNRNRNRQIGNYERNPVTEVGNKTARLAESVGGIAAHTARSSAEHSALGENIGNCRRAADGNDPGQNGHCPDLGQFRRHENNGGPQHVKHHGHRELHARHLRFFNCLHGAFRLLDIFPMC